MAGTRSNFFSCEAFPCRMAIPGILLSFRRRRAGRSSSSKAAIKCAGRATTASARSDLRPDLGAQRIDRDQAGRRLHVPEGPAVAGFEPLGKRADTMDRADRLAIRAFTPVFAGY